MNKTILIDSNSIGFAAQNGTRLTVGDYEVQAAFGFIRTVRSAMMMFPNSTPICLWDGKADWRYSIFPGYKDRIGHDEKMDKMRESYTKQVPDIKRMMLALGVRQARSENMEADDLAAIYSKKLSNAGKEVVLLTGDKDWLQLVNKFVSWREHRAERARTITLKGFVAETGCPDSDAFVQVKALTGDNSDTIPGVGGIGEKGAPDFLMQYESVENFFKLADEGKLGKVGAVLQRFADNGSPKDSKKYGKMLPMRDAYYRNLKLMDLESKDRPEPKNLKMVKSSFNESKFRELCEELSFNSILRNFSDWVQPFKG